MQSGSGAEEMGSSDTKTREPPDICEPGESMVGTPLVATSSESVGKTGSTLDFTPYSGLGGVGSGAYSPALGEEPFRLPFP